MVFRFIFIQEIRSIAFAFIDNRLVPASLLRFQQLRHSLHMDKWYKSYSHYNIRKSYILLSDYPML